MYLVDFDARTGHNHGTKFRMRQNCLPDLYEIKIVIRFSLIPQIIAIIQNNRFQKK